MTDSSISSICLIIEQYMLLANTKNPKRKNEAAATTTDEGLTDQINDVMFPMISCPVMNQLSELLLFCPRPYLCSFMEAEIASHVWQQKQNKTHTHTNLFSLQRGIRQEQHTEVAKGKERKKFHHEARSLSLIITQGSRIHGIGSWCFLWGLSSCSPHRSIFLLNLFA